MTPEVMLAKVKEYTRILDPKGKFYYADCRTVFGQGGPKHYFAAGTDRDNGAYMDRSGPYHLTGNSWEEICQEFDQIVADARRYEERKNATKNIQ
jgi:hypothetical protein